MGLVQNVEAVTEPKEAARSTIPATYKREDAGTGMDGDVVKFGAKGVMQWLCDAGRARPPSHD